LEWDAEERDAWVPDAQRWIGQIKGVLQSKVELESDGQIAGIHVVAGFDREPRHIVRDVESLLKARLGIDVYYKKIGVVQVLENGEDALLRPDISAEGNNEKAPDSPSPGVTFHPTESLSEEADALSLDDLLEDTPTAIDATESADMRGAGVEPEQARPRPAILVAQDMAPRVICDGVGVMVGENRVRAEVRLSAGELLVSGQVEKPNHPAADMHAVAEATLEALGRLYQGPFLLSLEELTTTRLGGREAVLAAVCMVEGRRSEILLGSCATTHNRQQAVVFSVLDALNRRFSQYPLQDAADD